MDGGGVVNGSGSGGGQGGGVLRNRTIMEIPQPKLNSCIYFGFFVFSVRSLALEISPSQKPLRSPCRSLGSRSCSVLSFSLEQQGPLFNPSVCIKDKLIYLWTFSLLSLLLFLLPLKSMIYSSVRGPNAATGLRIF